MYLHAYYKYKIYIEKEWFSSASDIKEKGHNDKYLTMNWCTRYTLSIRLMCVAFYIWISSRTFQKTQLKIQAMDWTMLSCYHFSMQKQTALNEKSFSTSCHDMCIQKIMDHDHSSVWSSVCVLKCIGRDCRAF